jgi:hypothetical protein
LCYDKIKSSLEGKFGPIRARNHRTNDAHKSTWRESSYVRLN